MNPFVVDSIPDKGNGRHDKNYDYGEEQRNSQKNPVEHSKQQFEDLLTCHICFCHVNSPMMCPHCSKLFC